MKWRPSAQPFRVRGTLEQKEKRFVVQKKDFGARLASGNKWQNAVRKLRKPGKTFFATLVIRTKTLQLLVCPFVYSRRGFATKLAFVGVITGRLCCLVTYQCCHFWCFNVKSDVLWEICEVWCFGDKCDLDWAKLFLFYTFMQSKHV